MFPRLTGGSGPVGWRRLPPTEAAAAIAGARLGSLRTGPPDGGGPAWIRDREPPDVAGSTRGFGTDEDRCRQLGECIPAFEVSLGRDVYDDVASASRLLEAVGG